MNSARYRHFYNNLPSIAIPERPFFPEKSHISEIFLRKPQILCGAAANCRLWCRSVRRCRSASQAVDHRPTGARTPAHESAAHSEGERCRLRWGYWGYRGYWGYLGHWGCWGYWGCWCCRECRVRRRAVVYVVFRLVRVPSLRWQRDGKEDGRGRRASPPGPAERSQQRGGNQDSASASDAVAGLSAGGVASDG